MKKAILFMMATMMMVGCAEQQDFQPMATNTSSATAKATKTESYSNYLAKARWGDGKAYLKLAECHIYGEEVRPDFLGAMTMLSLSRDYGGIPDIRTYVKSLPEDNNVRIACEAMDKIDQHEEEKAMEISDELIAKGFTDGYPIKSFAYMQLGDTAKAMQMATIGAEKGSTLGKAILFMEPIMFQKSMPDEELTDSLAEEVPALYRLLGEEFTNRAYKKPQYMQKAIQYFLKAEEKGVLGKDNIHYLINYKENGNDIPLTETDMQRLKQQEEELYVTPYVEELHNNMGLWKKDLPEVE